MPELPERDDFESELLTLDIQSERSLATLEKKLGLDGGGSWWLDLTRPAVEVDGHGSVDMGAIVDVEAEAHAWLRHSFDHNPEFRDNSYHLLGRLNDLARLKGLSEQMSLEHNSSADLGPTSVTDSSLGNFDSLDPTELNIKSCQADKNGKFSVRASYDLPNDGKPRPTADFSVLNRTFSKMTGLPNLKKSQQPPSAHTSHLQPPPRRTRRHSPHLKICDIPLQDDTNSTNYLTVNQQWSTPPLNRTYSKDALNKLKDSVLPSTRQSGSSLLDRLLRESSSQYGPVSDPSSIVDVTQSADFNTRGISVLSNSLTDGELQSFKLSRGRTNASYSSMRSTDVIELARMQENLLRHHSGSFGKLNGSTSSLGGSMANGLQSSINYKQNNLRVSDDDALGRELLSHSLADGELQNMVLSQGRTNASFSSMRSTDVIELARMQEYQLRNHSGSFGKLHESTSSLGGSAIDENQLPTLHKQNGLRVSDVKGHGNGGLSHSLADDELQSLKLSTARTNASYSSMRITDVIELARMQEQKLRSHNGSLGKLRSSVSSLGSSAIGDLQMSTEYKPNDLRVSGEALLYSSSDGNIQKDLIPTNMFRTNPAQTTGGQGRRMTVAVELEQSSDYSRTNTRSLGRYKPPIVALDHSSAQNHGTELLPELPTPVVGMHTTVPHELHTLKTEHTSDNVFFPDNVEPIENSKPYEYGRSDSQQSFEELEARLSHETFLQGDLDSTDVNTYLPNSIQGKDILTQSTDMSNSLDIVGTDSVDDLGMAIQDVNFSSSARPAVASEVPSISKLPIPSSRIPTAPTRAPRSKQPPPTTIRSQHAPTLNARALPRTRAGSAQSSVSKSSARQPTSKLPSENLSAQTDKKIERQRDIPRVTTRKPEMRPKRESEHAVLPKSTALTTPKPTVYRSDTSPVRSTSRRFNQAPRTKREGHRV